MATGEAGEGKKGISRKVGDDVRDGAKCSNVMFFLTKRQLIV